MSRTSYTGAKTGYSIEQKGDNGQPQLHRDISGMDAFSIITPKITTTRFTFISAAYTGATVHAFGDAISYPASNDARTMPSLPAIAFKIGSDLYGTNPGDTYLGDIDELRVSTRARSADWVATEFANVNNPGAFYDVGPEVAK